MIPTLRCAPRWREAFFDQAVDLVLRNANRTPQANDSDSALRNPIPCSLYGNIPLFSCLLNPMKLL